MIRTSILTVTLASVLTWVSYAQDKTASTPKQAAKEQLLLQELIGTWEIDLRPSADAAPYLKDFTITGYENQTLSGVFYDTKFTNGRINTGWDKIYFAFTTGDNSGTYYHSGYLENNKLYGTSFSPNRQFMLPWFGVRKK